jgi:putative alpha-1,2-mannosidase
MNHPVDDIDPLIGALTTLPDTACGKTFPGPVLPFIYVAAARLNDQPTDRPWLTHDELVAGGNLSLAMSPTPTDWGAKLRP